MTLTSDTTVNLRRISRLLLVSVLMVTMPACDSVAHQDQALSVLALSGRVVDEADVLSVEAESRISDRLAELERRTGHQMVAVSVRSLAGRDIGDVARDLGNRWGVGRKAYDDGVILLVAPTERRVRIAVGRGLEGVLTDERCREIIDVRILPLFRKGDLEGGMEAGAEAIVASLGVAL